MKFDYTIDDKIVFFTFTGDLIGENQGPELVEIAGNLLNQGVNLITIDISSVRFINSSGIGVLITLLTKFRNKGGDLVLINPSDQVNNLLIITKLNAIFTITKDKKEAIQKLKNN
ncbi:MAG: STAS domain-containing protein [Bacteroidetes bacterium]|nr:STAS domain-containing protein [Bacteroidota bacterium]